MTFHSAFIIQKAELTLLFYVIIKIDNMSEKGDKYLQFVLLVSTQHFIL